MNLFVFYVCFNAIIAEPILMNAKIYNNASEAAGKN